MIFRKPRRRSLVGDVSKNQRGKDELAETIKSRDQIGARVSSGKCIPCSVPAVVQSLDNKACRKSPRR